MISQANDIPLKERLIVQRLRDFINDGDPDAYFVALIAGIRKVGKTTVLRQLQASFHNAVYIDFYADFSAEEALDDALRSGAKLLL